MMSPYLLLFLLSQTLTYVSFFIFSTPLLTLVTKAHRPHTFSPSPVISWSRWCSLPQGPCPSPLHSHPVPPAPAPTLPRSSWGMLEPGLLQHHRALLWSLCKHQLSSGTSLQLPLSKPVILPKFLLAQSPPTHTWSWSRAELLLPKFCLVLGCSLYFRV